MKTNIDIDNYEAYLLDYMEGNLSPDETAQLKAFVAAQGLDWDELTQALPHLEPPTLTYNGKENLKKKAAIVPLYVKIASAAAAAGLLLTVTLWPEKSLPKVEPVAALKPIEASLTIDEPALCLVARRATPLSAVPIVKSNDDDKTAYQTLATSNNANNKAESVATLPPLKPQSIATMDDAASSTDLALLRYRLEARQAFNQLVDESTLEEMPTSFIGRTIYRWSQGRYSSFNDLVNAGLTRSKKEITGITTEIAMELQQRTEEHFADARDYWQEKTEKWK